MAVDIAIDNCSSESYERNLWSLVKIKGVLERCHKQPSKTSFSVYIEIRKSPKYGVPHQYWGEKDYVLLCVMFVEFLLYKSMSKTIINVQ